MDVEEARTIGARLRLIRNARQKSLVVVAGLAGVSKSHLSRIERGERALDSRSETVALANALQIAPSELTGCQKRHRSTATRRRPPTRSVSRYRP